MENSHFKKSATEQLRQSGGTSRRLLLIYSSCLSGLFLLSTLGPMLLSLANAGSGLSAIGTQAIITTVAVALRLLPVLLLPFLTAGLRFAGMQLIRGQDASATDLLEGFRHLGSMLFAVIFQVARYALLGYVAYSLGQQIFLYTPLGQNALEGLIQGEYVFSTNETLVCGSLIVAVFLLFAVPVFYRYRILDYIIMDGAPAMPALMVSRIMTHRRRMQLLRMDLSFWWVWAGIVLAVLAGYVSLFLTLPFWWLEWILPFFGAAVLLLLGIFALPKVLLTYASCYDNFRQAPAVAPEKRPIAAEKLPWDGWQ